MAKNSKNGKDSKETEKLKKEQAATEKAQAEREAEMKDEEAAKLEKAQEESENQAPPIAQPAVAPDKERKAAWDKFLKEYKEQNPEKFAQKEKAGEFKEIPASFTGGNQLKIQE